jgi:protocatechuate 3,4-dioxygenase alpha subunit
MSHIPTSSQTVGPFFHGALVRDGLEVLAGPEARGERIVLEGCVLDGEGQPVPDAMLEIWQADSGGLYSCDAGADPAFRGFGRARTDTQGHYAFRTVMPGRVAESDGKMQAPHLLVTVFARGLLRHLTTRVYFPDQLSNEADPVLLSIADPAARRTLVAVLATERPPRVFRFDVRLRGDRETVFFDL